MPKGNLKFPLFGQLVFPRCLPNRHSCCRVHLINELFPAPRAAPANCSVVVPYLHGVHGGAGGTPPWIAAASTERRVMLTFVGGSKRGPGARGDYLRSLEAAARWRNRKGHQRSFAPMYVDDEFSHKWQSLDYEGPDNEAFYAKMWRAYSEADFSLQPPGDTATRRGFYDSWMHGCIPIITIHTALQYLSLFNGLLFRDIVEFNRSAIIVDPSVLTGERARFLLAHLANMGHLDVTARRRRMRELAPAMQWRLVRDDSEPLDALHLTLMAARQLGGPHGASMSVLSRLDSKSVRIPHPSRGA